MTKRPVKLLPVWIAVSAVIIIAGIVLCALLGFNYSAERPEKKTFEVEYDVVVETAGGIDSLKSASEAAFKEAGLFVTDFSQSETISASNGVKTGGGKLIFTFASDASDEALAAAMEAVQTKAAEDFPNAQIYVSYHASYDRVFTEAAWRGAVAVAVGAVVALVYVGIRFGVGSALTGLTLCVHDAVFTLALLAITRIPVFYFAPMIIGAVAVFMSLLLWLVQCIKMRENFKDPSYSALSADEAVEQSLKTAQKIILFTAGAFAVVLAVAGIALAIGGAQFGAVLLPITCILSVGAATYSSLLFGPALHVHVKKAFDKLKAKRKRYFGKAKAEKQIES